MPVAGHFSKGGKYAGVHETVEGDPLYGIFGAHRSAGSTGRNYLLSDLTAPVASLFIELFVWGRRDCLVRYSQPVRFRFRNCSD